MTDPTVSKLQPNFNVIPFFLCNSFEVIDLSSSDVKLQSLFNLFPVFCFKFHCFGNLMLQSLSLLAFNSTLPMAE